MIRLDVAEFDMEPLRKLTQAVLARLGDDGTCLSWTAQSTQAAAAHTAGAHTLACPQHSASSACVQHCTRHPRAP